MTKEHLKMETRISGYPIIGKTIAAISGMAPTVAIDHEVLFNFSDGSSWRMFHSQDCCESVNLIDVCGDPKDLVGSPLLMAEAVSNNIDPPSDDYEEHYLWTFYKFATIKGSVTLRWYGYSNGYYSVYVDFEEVSKETGDCSEEK